MTINVFQPDTDEREAEAVRRVLASRWLGKGKITAEFESAWARHVGVDAGQIVSTNSATEGLFAVMRILARLGVRDVVMPSIGFVGAGNAALEAGVQIHYCDVDRGTLNARARDIEKAMPRGHGPLAVVLLHYGGLPCEMEEILALVQGRPDTCLIEDAACAPASRTLGQAAGIFGSFGVWSFDAMKVVTMGDGGMVYCATPYLANRMRGLSYLGMDITSGLDGKDDQWWSFRSDGEGRRSITNDIASAIGLEQLKKLPAFVSRRREVSRMYDERLAELEWLTLAPAVPDGVESSYCFYWIQTDDRDGLAHHLREKGIYTTFRYWPLHRAYGVQVDLPNTEWAADHTLLLPLHTDLSDGDVDTICDAVRDLERVRV